MKYLAHWQSVSKLLWLKKRRKIRQNIFKWLENPMTLECHSKMKARMQWLSYAEQKEFSTYSCIPSQTMHEWGKIKIFLQTKTQKKKKNQNSCYALSQRENK